MSNKSVHIPGTHVPIWITIAQIISVTLLLLALIFVAMYLFQLVFEYIIIPIMVVVIRAISQTLIVIKSPRLAKIK